LQKTKKPKKRKNQKKKKIDGFCALFDPKRVKCNNSVFSLHSSHHPQFNESAFHHGHHFAHHLARRRRLLAALASLALLSALALLTALASLALLSALALLAALALLSALPALASLALLSALALRSGHELNVCDIILDLVPYGLDVRSQRARVRVLMHSKQVYQ
jgi:hypothetical protein